MKNTVIKYGLISGALISVMMVLTIPFHDQIGFETTGIVVGYTTMVLAFLLVYFGVRSYSCPTSWTNIPRTNWRRHARAVRAKSKLHRGKRKWISLR